MHSAVEIGPQADATILSECLTMKKIVLLALPLGIVAGVIWVRPSFNAPRQVPAPANHRIDVGQIERDARVNTTRSFDDHYQRYIGVLDVLRHYPGP
jgi:hypothetical protein